MIQLIENQLRAVAAQTRKLYRSDGFDIFIDPNSPTPHHSLAVPSHSPNWPEAIHDMMQIFGQNQRQARLEYISEAHPELSTHLEAAGFECEMTAPVMVLDKGKLTHLTHRQGKLHALSADSPLLETFISEQNRAYGMGDDDMSWLPKLRQGLARKQVFVAVLEYEDRLVAGATVQLADTVGELAGVWTHTAYRKQGLAFELCQQLLTEFFHTGSLCWLSAAEGAQRLYLKLGFENLAQQLNYALTDKQEVRVTQ